VYDKPFRIMLNLAVGGVWDGAPDATTPFPATLTADWIKLEQWR
jgi:beta-glucanase (GH16 family)